jgi:hypothetical protein
MAIDLTLGRDGAPALFLLTDGFSTRSKGAAPTGLDATDALVRAARWVSSRRTSTFARLYAPPSARTERLDPQGAAKLLDQLTTTLEVVKVGGEAARADATSAAQLRSACATIASHVIATVRADATFAEPAARAAKLLFELVDREAGETSVGGLRVHAILLLSLRAPELSDADRAHTKKLLAELVRPSPPYAELPSTWLFAMCSGWEFHEGEVALLQSSHGFREIKGASDAPQGPSGRNYTVLEAPFKTPSGGAIRVLARRAEPSDELIEMGDARFVGVLTNRHAQLGSFDMRATLSDVTQRGYKLYMTSQCAGLTTRFAIGRMFPDADVYSSYDSTFFRKSPDDRIVVASEGADCFVAILKGMSAGETHATIRNRIRAAQWSHPQDSDPSFVQFIGPADPLVVARFSDVNRDGKADLYDGFFDLEIKDIAEDMASSATPRDPGVDASSVGGEAARGLDWAANSLDRVTQYSDLWSELPGDIEMRYAFSAAGFFSKAEPPGDVPGSNNAAIGAQPAVVRYVVNGSDVRADVMLNAWFAHAGKELKRLFVAADAFMRAVDAGLLGKRAPLDTPEGRRGAMLLTLAGLLEFPAEANELDALWSAALARLSLPDLSRSLVSGCITSEDHDADSYYGSKRGLAQLLATLRRSDPGALAKLTSSDASIGRLKPI